MTAYYNENDPFVAEWLRNLIMLDLIAPGDVDDRSIVEVHPDDLKGYTQCHFFAGIGGWSHALRLAEWPDDRPVWTGSCPCQPFSAAGRGKGADDARHLWPEWFRLLREHRPPVVFGEQVASPLGRNWLAAVRADLEDVGYAVGAADLCAAGAGAPHLRQRLWFVADTQDAERRRTGAAPDCWGRAAETGRSGITGKLGNPHDPRPQGRGRQELPECAGERGESVGLVADAECRTSERHGHEMGGASGEDQGRKEEWQRLWAHPWHGCEFIPCRDGKARPTEPGLFPLAHGIPGRVGRLRAYGNAIVPQVAAAFIDAYTRTED